MLTNSHISGCYFLSNLVLADACKTVRRKFLSRIVLQSNVIEPSELNVQKNIKKQEKKQKKNLFFFFNWVYFLHLSSLAHHLSAQRMIDILLLDYSSRHCSDSAAFSLDTQDSEWGKQWILHTLAGTTPPCLVLACAVSQVLSSRNAQAWMGWDLFPVSRKNDSTLQGGKSLPSWMQTLLCHLLLRPENGPWPNLVTVMTPAY